MLSLGHSGFRGVHHFKSKMHSLKLHFLSCMLVLSFEWINIYNMRSKPTSLTKLKYKCWKYTSKVQQTGRYNLKLHTGNVCDKPERQSSSKSQAKTRRNDRRVTHNHTRYMVNLTGNSYSDRTLIWQEKEWLFFPIPGNLSPVDPEYWYGVAIRTAALRKFVPTFSRFIYIMTLCVRVLRCMTSV